MDQRTRRDRDAQLIQAMVQVRDMGNTITPLVDMLWLILVRI
jgi:hypothetical protein